MKIRKIVDGDLPVVGRFLELEQERGYPRGNLSAIERIFSENGADLTENLFLIFQDEEPVGLIGTCPSLWGVDYLLGPILKKPYDQAEHVGALLAEFLPDKDVFVDVVDGDLILKQELEKLSVRKDDPSFVMSYSLKGFTPVAGNSQILELSVTDSAYIKQVNQLFATHMQPWATMEDSAEYEESLREAIAGNNNVTVVISESEVVGAVVWQWNGGLQVGELFYLCVKTDCRGSGYGRELLNGALASVYNESAASQGAKLNLDVDQNNEQALAFYKAFGFVVEYGRTLYVHEAA